LPISKRRPCQALVVYSQPEMERLSLRDNAPQTQPIRSTVCTDDYGLPPRAETTRPIPPGCEVLTSGGSDADTLHGRPSLLWLDGSGVFTMPQEMVVCSIILCTFNYSVHLSRSQALIHPSAWKVPYSISCGPWSPVRGGPLPALPGYAVTNPAPPTPSTSCRGW